MTNRHVDFDLNLPPEIPVYIVCRFHENDKRWEIVANYADHYFSIALPFAVGVACSIMDRWHDVDRLSIFCIWKEGLADFCGCVEREKAPWPHYTMAPMDRHDYPDNMAIATFNVDYSEHATGKKKLTVTVLG